jgi:hypothetical protein
MTDDEMKILKNALDRIESLEYRIKKLENDILMGTHLPATSLLSDSFLRRAFTVFGHYFVASLIIAIPIWIIGLIAAFVSGGF